MNLEMYMELIREKVITLADGVSAILHAHAFATNVSAYCQIVLNVGVIVVALAMIGAYSNKRED